MITDADITWLILIERGSGNGYADHPNDSGGPTMDGITAATLGRSRKLGRPATRAEVLGLKEPETRAIYRAGYVVMPGIDRIDDHRIAMFLFDCAVQFGGDDQPDDWEGVAWMQEAIGGLKPDGYLGPITLGAYRAVNDKPGLLLNLWSLRMAKRRRVVRRNASQLDFAGGWWGRDAALAAYLAANP